MRRHNLEIVRVLGESQRNGRRELEVVIAQLDVANGGLQAPNPSCNAFGGAAGHPNPLSESWRAEPSIRPGACRRTRWLQQCMGSVEPRLSVVSNFTAADEPNKKQLAKTAATR